MIDLSATKKYQQQKSYREGRKLLISKTMDECEKNDRIQMDFLEVCSFGDLKQAEEMLKNGQIDINFHHHGNGWTALHWAARRNHREIVELLMQAGFNPKSPAKDGKTPLDLVTNKAVKEILVRPVNMSKVNQLTSQIVSVEEKKSLRENNYDIKNGRENGQFRKSKNSLSKTKQLAKSFDSATTTSNTSFRPTLIKHEFYPYGRRDSLNRTRFLLVRTSVGNGKESFKRVTFPGHGSIDTLKLTIEKVMRKGKVLEVITLPDMIKIETEQQVRDLANHQKVDVIFEPSTTNKESKYGRNLSLDEAATENPRHSLMFEKKTDSIACEHLNKSASRDQSTDDIVSLSDDNNPPAHDDYANKTNGSDSIPKKPSLSTEMHEKAVISECLLTAQSSTSATDVTLPPKIIIEEMMTLQAARLPQNNCEVGRNESFQMPEQKSEENGKLPKSGNETLTGPEVPVPSTQMSINVCSITNPDGLAVVQVDDYASLEEELKINIFKKVSQKRTFKMALLVGCIVAFGSLTYMVYKK